MRFFFPFCIYWQRSWLAKCLWAENGRQEWCVLCSLLKLTLSVQMLPICIFCSDSWIMLHNRGCLLPWALKDEWELSISASSPPPPHKIAAWLVSDSVGLPSYLMCYKRATGESLRMNWTFMSSALLLTWNLNHCRAGLLGSSQTHLLVDTCQEVTSYFSLKMFGLLLI